MRTTKISFTRCKAMGAQLAGISHRFRQNCSSIENSMALTSRRIARTRPLMLAVPFIVGAVTHRLPAQWSGPYEQAYLRAPHNRAFAGRFSTAADLLNAIDYQRASLYELLWREAGMAPSTRDSIEFVRLSRVFNSAPRVWVETRAVAPQFAKLSPETQAILTWGRVFRRQLLDALTEPSTAPSDRDGRIAELVANYRARTDLALAVRSKSLDLLDGQLQSLAFRTKYPRLNSLGWATRWLQAGLYEALVIQSSSIDTQANALLGRFRQMIQRPGETTPFLLPLTAALAPTFTNRYPNAAAIVDNLNMFEDAITDVLVSREIPRSVKHGEMDTIRTQFQSDTAFVQPLSVWAERALALGVNNMGGPTIGFGSAFPTPTVARGASMATPAAAAAHAHGGAPSSMPDMQHGNTQQTQASQQELMAIYARMMSDPVIRERAATDPMLQKMLRDARLATDSGMGGMPGMSNMPGMEHDSSAHAMPMSPSSAASMLRGTPEERRRALDFVVRLLSDPAVEARIHSYPELHALWADPEVQRRLTELKKTIPAPRPTDTASPTKPTPR